MFFLRIEKPNEINGLTAKSDRLLDPALGLPRPLSRQLRDPNSHFRTRHTNLSHHANLWLHFGPRKNEGWLSFEFGTPRKPKES